MADSWEDAIERLGLDRAPDLRNVVTRQFETKVITKEGRQELSLVERKAILTNWNFQDKKNGVPAAEASTNVLLVAKMRGYGILGRWRERREQLISKKKYEYWNVNLHSAKE